MSPLNESKEDDGESEAEESSEASSDEGEDASMDKTGEIKCSVTDSGPGDSKDSENDCRSEDVIPEGEGSKVEETKPQNASENKSTHDEKTPSVPAQSAKKTKKNEDSSDDSSATESDDSDEEEGDLR